MTEGEFTAECARVGLNFDRVHATTERCHGYHVANGDKR